MNVHRIAHAAVYGGGGVGVLSASALGLLFLEGVLARRTVGQPASEPPFADGLYGEATGEPLQLLILGDSAAAGLGVGCPTETPGGMLATALVEATDRPVRLLTTAVVGARSPHLAGQLDRALQTRLHPDITVIVVGANDVTHVRSPRASAAALSETIRQLRTLGSEVVVGTCPDLGTVQPIPQPLRALARQVSRRLAAEQAVAVVEAGARAVSLGDLLGPEFAAQPGVFFGPDRFHPSATGYAAAVGTLLPSVRAAAGVEPEPHEARPHGVLPVRVAAAEAARDPGTEVSRGHIAGRQRGPRGRFAALRRRMPLHHGAAATT